MPRCSNRIPSYCQHKATGQAYVKLDGRRRYLGRHGTPESKQAYDREIAAWLAKGRIVQPTALGATIIEVVAAYMAHAIEYYRNVDGEPTGESENMKNSLTPLVKLYGTTEANDFDVERLDAVRAMMVESGLSRKVVNSRVNRIRRAFRWAASRKLIPPSVVVSLSMLAPLSKHRTAAPESKGISPVSEATVRATMPHMPPAVAAMVEIQLLTGCRVSEVTSMTLEDIDRSVDPWEYRPGRHKGDHRESGRRVVFIGPKAQAVLLPFLESKRNVFLFDPRDSAKRSKVKRRYDRRTYAQAIYRACDRAFLHPVISRVKRSRTVKLTEEQKADLRKWRREHRWSPLQIRHTAGTRVRKENGLEASQAVLGHARADVTQIYADRLDDLAREIARSSG